MCVFSNMKGQGMRLLIWMPMGVAGQREYVSSWCKTAEMTVLQRNWKMHALPKGIESHTF